MDAERLMGLIEAACRDVVSRWALIGGMAMNAYGHARTTLDFDIAAEEGARKTLLSRLAAEGFEVLNDVEGFTNLRHPDAELEYLLRFPGLDDNEARGFFERAGLLELYDRLRRTR